jgi:membrane protein required for colicin V production
MDIFSHMTTYDLAVAVLIVFFISRGLWQGFLKQVTGLLALYLGYFVASQHSDKIYPSLQGISNNPKVIFLLACVIVFLVTYLAVIFAVKALSYVIKMTIVGWFDHLLGGIVGACKAAIMVIIVHLVLGTILPPQSTVLKDCMSCTVLNDATTFTWRLLSSEEMRKSLREQEPAKAIEVMKNYLAPAEPSKKQHEKSKHDEGKTQ